MELLQVVHSTPAGARSASVAATDAPAFTTTLPNDKIPVAPLVLVAVHLSGLVYVVDAARQLFFAEVVDQPGVFLFGEPHPSMRAVLMAGDLGAVIFGGVSQVPQVEAIERGVDILIATPGRLWDLMGQKIVKLDKAEFFVLGSGGMDRS